VCGVFHFELLKPYQRKDEEDRGQGGEEGQICVCLCARACCERLCERSLSMDLLRVRCGVAQLWFGLQCSVRPAVSILTLNADTTAVAVYPEGTALDLARNLGGDNFLNGYSSPSDLSRISKVFRGLKVGSSHSVT
jgi:hypothetical protein